MGKGESQVVDSGSNSGWVLAIDTATDQAGIALYDGEHLYERSWPGGRQQTVTVLPQVEQLLTEAGMRSSAVGAVAVTIGPGSFTGLRVGLSIAKGIVIAENCGLVGVPTLDVAAKPYLSAGVDCVVVSPAGRGRVIWAAYHAGREGAEPVNTSFDEFVDGLRRFDGRLIVAELTSQQRETLLGAGANLAPQAASYRRAGVLAGMALDRWRRGELDDPVMLEPSYLHGRPNPR